MALVLQDRPSVGPSLDREPTDVAAWTLRHDGTVTTWRAPGLEANRLIGPWALAALIGCNYADLLYSELAALV